MLASAFTIASLFCGAGGLDLGFEKAGFSTIWANDYDNDCCKTYRLWSSAEVVHGDISAIEASNIPKADIILGGFPCQGFSLSGPRKASDSRNRLYKEYVRIVRALNPLCFIGENVKGLLTMANGGIIKSIIAEFSECGYDVYCQYINCSAYGIPQDRERVIIAGFRKDLNVGAFSLPEYKGGKKTLSDALRGVKASDDEICFDPFSSRYMSRNRKRGWDEASYTIPAMAKQVPLYPGSPDMSKESRDSWRFGEGGETRRLSWRECAAIQTFPPDMEFIGSLRSKYKQIGNAVPVALGSLMAAQVRSVLTERL